MTGHPQSCFCYQCRGDFDTKPEEDDPDMIPRSPPPEETAPDIWQLCDEVKNSIRKISERMEQFNMINRTQQSTENGGKRGRGRRDNLIPFLNVESVAHEPTEATIVAARVEPDTFKPGTDAVSVKLQYRGKIFLWTLRMNNPNLEILCDALGDDETKWTNTVISLYTETDDFNGKVWIRVSVPTRTKRK